MSKDIYQALNDVMQQVGYVQKQMPKGGYGGVNYTYAGEAALVAAIRPHCVEHGIIVHPHEVAHVEKDVMVYRFAHAPSGTFIDIPVTGEGADVGDKSANKALTGAYKYALRQTLLIETGDDPDDFASEPRSKPVTTGPKYTEELAPEIKDPRAELRTGRCTVGKVASLANASILYYNDANHALNALAGKNNGAGYPVPKEWQDNGFSWKRSQPIKQETGVLLFDWLNDYASKSADKAVA
jgi:hypothetical protein